MTTAGVAPHTLSVSGWDLLEVAGTEEPLVRDVDLAERLGYERPRKIRELIKSCRAELEQFGPICERPRRGRSQTPTGGEVEREDIEFFLNEPQAVLLASLSRTEKSAAVRHDLIAVYMSWRRGAVVMANSHLAEQVSSLALSLKTFAEALAAMAKEHQDFRAEITAKLERFGQGSISGLQVDAIKMRVRELATLRVVLGEATSKRSAHRSICNELGGVSGWNGTGRNWANMPVSQHSVASPTLDHWLKKARAACAASEAAKKAATDLAAKALEQLPLFGAEAGDKPGHKK